MSREPELVRKIMSGELLYRDACNVYLLDFENMFWRTAFAVAESFISMGARATPGRVAKVTARIIEPPMAEDEALERIVEVMSYGE